MIPGNTCIGFCIITGTSKVFGTVWTSRAATSKSGPKPLLWFQKMFGSFENESPYTLDALCLRSTYKQAELASRNVPRFTVINRFTILQIFMQNPV
jgi:hypothetical protein